MNILDRVVTALLLLTIAASSWASERGSFEWLARSSQVSAPTSEVSRLNNLAFQLRNGKLERIGANQRAIEVHALDSGQWKATSSTVPVLTGRMLPNVVSSFDQQQSYAWIRDDTLKVVVWSNNAAPRQVFSIATEPIRKVIFSQGNARLMGDEKYGFWVVNDYEGSAVFIEPSAWAIRNVEGLSVENSSQSRTPLFDSAVLGKEGSLWTLEKKGTQLVRRNAQGQELVRVQAPFVKSVPPDEMSSFGAGVLHTSLAGVVVLSSTLLEMASFDHDGRELWRTTLCPEGLSTSCAQLARMRGQLGAVQAAVGDETGNVYAYDSSRIFLLRGPDEARRSMIYGLPASCIPHHAAGGAARPCVGDEHRAIPLDDKRWLVFALNPTVSEPFEMSFGSSPTTKVTFQSLSTRLMDLPFKTRQAIVDSVYDLRLWPEVSLTHSAIKNMALRHRQLGIPTGSGLITRNSIIRPLLSPPGDAIRSPEDEELNKLFDKVSERSFPGARLGQNGVVIKDYRAQTTRVALYDAKKRSLKQNLMINGLPKAHVCSEFDTRDEYLFNDDKDNLYFLRGRSGEVFVIDMKLNARLVARLPQPAVFKPETCAQTRSLGAVRNAVKTSSGSLLIATGAMLLVQNGDSFFAVDAPQGIQQIIPINQEQVIVLAAGGLAHVKLPTVFKSPSRLRPEDLGNPSELEPLCGAREVSGQTACGSR